MDAIQLSNFKTEQEFIIKEEFKKMKNDISYFILASNTPNNDKSIICYGLAFLCIVIVLSVIILKTQENNANNEIMKNSKALISLIDNRIKLKTLSQKISSVTASDIEVITDSDNDEKNKK